MNFFRTICSTFVIFFVVLAVYLINDSRVKVKKIRNDLFLTNESLEKLDKDLDIRLNLLEQRISILDQSVEPKNKRWARIKLVRSVIQDELRLSGLSKSLQINDITEIASSIIDFSEEYDIEVGLILAITRRESHFNPFAISKTNAKGLMQLVDSTAKECADDLGKKYFNIFKVHDNIQLGSWYMWKMLNRFKNNYELAIRAYNAGPVLVEKVLSGEIDDYPSETKKYVVDVVNSYEFYKNKGL